jgi:hypothetical protein
VSNPLLSTADFSRHLTPEPAQETVKVDPCEGCGKLPHGGTTGEANCLRLALRAARAEISALKRRRPYASPVLRPLPADDPRVAEVLRGNPGSR